jgi:MFS family permease
MTNEDLGPVKGEPKSAGTRRAMWLGLSTLLVIPILSGYTAGIRPWIDKHSSITNLGGRIGFGIGVCSLILSIGALVAGVRAYRKGERSRDLWVGLIPAILVSAFWVVMLVGEFIFPH